MRVKSLSLVLCVAACGCIATSVTRDTGDAGHDAMVLEDAGRDRQLDDGSVDASPPDAEIQDATLPDAGPPDSARCVELADDLPCVYNRSGAPDAHVLNLMRRALQGLGFERTAPEGPQPQDRVFVGRQYLVWIDETGFYGKANGLWRLNGEVGESLDFALTDRGERPVNTFIVGERGEGEWPAGYRGGEHLEFPNRTPERDDNPACADGDWCNQYGLSEAGEITLPSIPHWSSCNDGAPDWSTRREPLEVEMIPGGMRFVYEGLLVKIADGDGVWDADDCYSDWLFADGVRRPVFLRTGYELYDNESHFDRIFQFRNPEGNPDFEGPMSLIGGFVFSSWPEPFYLKRLHRYLRPVTRDIEDTRRGRTLRVGRWNRFATEPAAGDEVFSWLRQPLGLSAFPDAVAGRTVVLSHVGPSDNDDTGICLCSVHGGLEMGGGVLHGGISTPIAGGASTIEARRRLDLQAAFSAIRDRRYEAETDLSHAVGRRDADGWSANVADDEPGHMVFGPYATDWGESAVQVVFDLMIDVRDTREETIVTLDIFDATTEEALVTLQVPRRAFRESMRYQSFALDAELGGRAAHRMEARVFWHRRAYVRVDSVRTFLLR